MNALKKALVVLPTLMLSTGAFAGNISGNYLVTVKARPPAYTGATACATIVQDGSTLGFPVSGTVSINFGGGQPPYSGNWFQVDNTKGATFEIPLDSQSASYITFSGVFGAPQIAGSSFIEVIYGSPVVAGSFTAAKNGC